ncbi:MAG TPA: galactokinase, partial [Cyclobacteriaceae bacterium]|nr:galactokinase [Cyclobacteriaceae bacterium]
TDNVTTIYASDVDENITIDLDNVTKIKSPHWANYLLGVIYRLKENGFRIKPFKCLFGGNIPVGSGLSSSAALECGFVYALNTLNNFGISPRDMIFIAQWSEHHYAGVMCGIMDQFSSMMGKEDQVFVLDCRSLTHTYFPLQLHDYELVLFDTNVKHSLAGSEYNIRRSECEEGVEILRRYYPSIRNLRDVSPAMVKEHEAAMPSKVFNRCLYVAAEIERVQSAGDDLANGDLHAFGAKMYETHEGLSVLYEVSCPELDFLVDATRNNPDVLGARMMGGGFGGCTINIVRTSIVKSLEQEVREKYRQKFGIELKVYEVKIKNGVSQIK